MQFCNSAGGTTGAPAIPIALKVTFDANGNFNVSDKSGIITQGTWTIKLVDVNSWGLELSSPSVYLYGRILFCENSVLFNNKYVDGCDTVFDKQK